MAHYLIDLNVVLDVFLVRNPHVQFSEKILALVESGAIQGSLCADSFSTLFYLIKKERDDATARIAISTLRKFIGVVKVDTGQIDAAIALSWSDFEDAIVYASARDAGLDGIISRDSKGFVSGELPIYSPQSFLAQQ